MLPFIPMQSNTKVIVRIIRLGADARKVPATTKNKLSGLAVLHAAAVILRKAHLIKRTDRDWLSVCHRGIVPVVCSGHEAWQLGGCITCLLPDQSSFHMYLT